MGLLLMYMMGSTSIVISVPVSNVSCESVSNVSCESASNVSCESVSNMSCEYASTVSCESISNMSCESVSSVSCESASNVSCESASNASSECDIWNFSRKWLFDSPPENPDYRPLPEERPGGFNWGEGARLQENLDRPNQDQGARR